jgi:hypothetical protein
VSPASLKFYPREGWVCRLVLVAKHARKQLELRKEIEYHRI